MTLGRLAIRFLCWSLAAMLLAFSVACMGSAAYLAAPSIDDVIALATVAVLAGAAVAAAAGLVLAPGLGLSRRVGAAVLALLAAVTSSTLLVLLAGDGRTAVAAAAADGRGPHETWELPTGSRLAVWRRPADTPRHRTPVVFLHGGPGMYTQASKMAEGAALRAAGFDTVYFDQAGGGASDRLPVGQYTMERAIADVDAVRELLGVPQVVLWGNSYGGQLAAAYTAAHPDRVAGLLLTSPGTFPGTEADRDYSVTNRSDDTELSGRMLLATLLIDANPVLAEDLVGQAESGAMLDAATHSDLAGGFVCKGADDAPLRTELATERGGNLFPNRLLATAVETHGLPRSTVDVPTLVIRGACDFVPRTSAERYTAFAKPSRLIDIPADGHGLRLNRPAVDAAVTDFATHDLSQLP